MKKPLIPELVYISKGVKASVGRGDVMVKFGSRAKDGMAIFALVRKHSIEVSILYVLPQVAPIISSLSTYCAFVAQWASRRVLHNILIQLLVVRACKQRTLEQIPSDNKTNSTSKNYVYLAKNAVGIFMQTSYMVVEMGPRGEGLLAIFAGVCKASRKVNIFHMLPQVAPVTSLFPTDCALVHFWSTFWILHNVLIEHCHTHIACNIIHHKI